jgi:bacterioferritin (cytochrome b1)
MATGVHGRAVADLFKEHADEEREHSDKIADRIQQLGGKPNFNPGDLVQRSVSQYIEGETLADMIREDLIAERIVIDVYQRMIEYFGTKDPTTRLLIEHIKGEEEEHASELSDMLFIVNPHTGEDEGQDPGTNPLHLRDEESSGDQQSFYRGSQSNEQPRREVAFSDDEESDETEEETSTRDWGNESNVGKLGKGNPVRRSTAPKATDWGNEQNIGKAGDRFKSEASGKKGDGRLRSALIKEKAKAKAAPVREERGAQKSARAVQKKQKSKRAA